MLAKRLRQDTRYSEKLPVQRRGPMHMFVVAKACKWNILRLNAGKRVCHGFDCLHTLLAGVVNISVL